MKRWITFISCWLIASFSLSAQMPETPTSADILLQLKKLKVLGSVLYIAAHPDDENNGLLPYLAKEKLYRTAYLSLTRGDGGQNLIGSEQGVELGLIRTQELLAARRIDGSEQYFSRAFEFGFSKNASEALRIWDEQKILSDVVWMIRRYQPDIIITRFPQDARAGHGHHWASAILANKAFRAAADPTQFPEQLKYGVTPWQAKRILWNTYNFGSINTTASNQLKIDVGNFNPLLGKSYGEIGGEARSMHKSQGEGRPRRKGPIYEYFATTGGDTPHVSLMDGIDISWKRFKNGEKVDAMLDDILKTYNCEHPETIVQPLVNLYRFIGSNIENSVIRNKKLQEIQDLIVACSGLFAEAVSNEEYVVQGEKMNLNFFVNKRNDIPVEWKNVVLKNTSAPSFDSSVNVNLGTNENYSFDKTFTVPALEHLSQPYWLEKPQSNGSFTVDDQMMIGKSGSDPDYTATFIFSVYGVDFFVHKPVAYKYTDPVKGELYQPLVIIPKLIISLSPDNVLTHVSPGNSFTKSKLVELKIKSNYSAAKTPVKLQFKQGDDIVFSKDTVIDFETGRVYTMQFSLNQFHTQLPLHDIHVAVMMNEQGKVSSYSSYLRAIKYDHIPDIHYFYQDNIHVINDEVNLVGNKIGYIEGAGDKVPEALMQLGFQVDYLSESDMVAAKLKQYDAIIVGIRAYNIHEWLSDNNAVLNQYVENGGNLVVQYMKSNLVGGKAVKAGPYHFSVNGGSRVTQEDAVVHFSNPSHPVLNYPNKITEKDFEGWVQERSTYQAEQLDSHFETMLTMNDSGEKPSAGSLITAKYGKGNFAYVSLVLFRQLPAGVAGAYRLLANLIALPKNQ
ncbi:MAG: PIG-L family deacetylase [Bacteroidota bacterium]|nr:PIG-L family deacetylase [Bacteroidota bacterium]